MTRTTTTSRADIYERITAKIVEQLEQGTRPWMQPWGAGGSPIRPLRQNGIAYRGVNTVLLWMEAAEKGYVSPFWMTYRQAHQIPRSIVVVFTEFPRVRNSCSIQLGEGNFPFPSHTHSQDADLGERAPWLNSAMG